MNDEPLTLRLLIEVASRKHDASARALATMAQQHEFKIVGTTLSAILAGTYKSRPSDDTIRAIAWLAGVGEAVAFEAAGRELPGPPFASELPPGVDYLTPRKRKVVIDLLRVLVEEDRHRALNTGPTAIEGVQDEDQEPQQDQGSTTSGRKSGTGGRRRTSIAPVPDPPRPVEPDWTDLEGKAARRVDRKLRDPNYVDDGEVGDAR